MIWYKCGSIGYKSQLGQVMACNWKMQQTLIWTYAGLVYCGPFY